MNEWHELAKSLIKQKTPLKLWTIIGINSYGDAKWEYKEQPNKQQKGPG